MLLSVYYISSFTMCIVWEIRRVLLYNIRNQHFCEQKVSCISQNCFHNAPRFNMKVLLHRCQYANTDLTFQWRHNECDGVSNHQPHDCLLYRLFRRWSKKTSKLCVTDLCEGNSLVTGEFPAQMASNAENFPFDDDMMRIITYYLHTS